MKLSEFVIVLIATIVFFIPSKNQAFLPRKIQAQEEAPLENQQSRSFKLSYQVRDIQNEEMADIIWMKKAAEVAIDAGVPYFNLVEQKRIKKTTPHAKEKLSFIQGIIELDPNPMRAEFDAQEIQSLLPAEYPE